MRGSGRGGNLHGFGQRVVRPERVQALRARATRRQMFLPTARFRLGHPSAQEIPAPPPAAGPRRHHQGFQRLGEALAISDAQVRKDLAYLGNLGQPGIGYLVPDLIEALRHRLGIDRQWSADVVGVGNLARALLRYRGFERQGFRFVALFDTDPPFRYISRRASDVLDRS
jgi:hypothetical protein